MKCPKCGNDYEGNKCPYCGGLDIVVNSSDYARRKKAYEEQNSGAADKEKAAAKDKTVSNKKENRRKNKKTVSQNGRDTAGSFQRADAGDTHKDANGKAPRKNGEPTERQKKRRLFVCAGVGTLLAVGIILVGYFSVKNMVSIYFKIGTDIYKDDYVVEAHQVAKDDEIWNADTSRLFSVGVPAELSGKTVTDKMASMDGDYFSVITYDSILNYHTIWVWNSEGDSVERMLTTENSLELVYVADDGSVIYKNNEMVGEGTLVGNSLNKIDDNKSVYTVSENVAKEYIFLRDKSIVYLTTEGNLYVSYFNNVRESTLIASDVNAIMAELKYCEDRYSESAMTVHDSYLTSQVIYVTNDGKVMYVNLSNAKKGKTLFETEKTGLDIVYQENSDYAYSISRMSIDGIMMENDSYEVTALAKLKSGGDAIYLSNDEKMVYITQSGKLVSINFRNGSFSKKLLEGEQLVNGKTSRIYLTDGDEGLLVYNDSKYYFYRNIEEEPVHLEAYDGGEPRFLSYYGRKIYMVDDNKIMYIFDGKGNLEDTVENTEFIWVG